MYKEFAQTDESGGCGWSAPEAIGEIVRARPDDYADFVPILVSDARRRSLTHGVIWALGRIGKRRPDLVVAAEGRLWSRALVFVGKTRIKERHYKIATIPKNN